MPSKKSKVQFFSDDIRPNLRNIKKLKLFIESIFKNEGKSLESLNYVFCNDKKLLEINRKYLNHNFYTDVITFDLSETKKIIIGEVYISHDRIRENAKTLNESYSREVHRVLFHGALHLCGHNDKSVEQKKKIREAEDALLNSYLRK